MAREPAAAACSSTASISQSQVARFRNSIWGTHLRTHSLSCKAQQLADKPEGIIRVVKRCFLQSDRLVRFYQPPQLLIPKITSLLACAAAHSTHMQRAQLVGLHQTPCITAVHARTPAARPLGWSFVHNRPIRPSSLPAIQVNQYRPVQLLVSSSFLLQPHRQPTRAP